MILKTFDGKETYVTKEQAESIQQAIAAGTKLLNINGNMFAAGAIATILKGGEPPKLNVPRLEAHKLNEEELEERRKHRLAKLAAMKKDLITKGVFKG